MNDKTCNRCGKKGLGWDLEFHKKMGKWKLDNHRVNGKWCNKPKEITMSGKKSDYDICELCDTTPYGKFLKGDKEEHLRKYHPNNEVLTELDYIASMTKLSNHWLKFWKSDKHYNKYQEILNK